ncbi:MAG: ComF family protein [Lysobacterales bacterium]
MNRSGPVDGWLRRVSFRVLPASCLLCGQHGAAGIDLCHACVADLPWQKHKCRRCAIPLPLDSDRCGRCLRRAPAFDAAITAFRYDWPLDALIARFKFSADLAAGRTLAGLLGESIDRALTQSALPRPQWIVPVPLHPSRLAERGFNQALELAAPLARRLALPLDLEALIRARATTAQTGLDAKSRRRNLRDAFIARDQLAGRHLALVDDVITTSATAQECARVLKRAGAATVQVWALARAEAGHGSTPV